MFTCIACSKQLSNDGSLRNEKNGREDKEEVDSLDSETPRTKQAIKTLTSQIKDIAIKASGAYRSCKPCPGFSNNSNNNRKYADSDTASESTGFNYSYRRAGSSASTPRTWGKEMETRHRRLSSEEGTPSSQSGRIEPVIFVEDAEPKEWIAQVEPGVLITFVSLPRGGNDLKRIRFSREMFNKWQAQRWWSDNYDKVMELYNVRRLSHQSVGGGGGGVPLQTPSRSADEPESVKDSPATPPLSNERPRNGRPPPGMGYSSSESVDHHHQTRTRQFEDAPPNASTGMPTSSGGAKADIASANESERTSLSEPDHSGELSVGNASDMETEWVEQDEPGVFITIRALPDGTRELRRVRFSRERFGEAHARLWWEENRARIQDQYLG